MSRRASLFAKENPGEKKPKGVRFPDELVFLDSIKENDIGVLDRMLRRASLQVDISGINNAGKTYSITETSPYKCDTKFTPDIQLLAHLSRRLIGELIVYPWSGVRRPSVRRPSGVRPSSVHNAQTSSSQKPLGRS